MKKEMKLNYYADENKLFNQPGRRYHASESSYHFQRDGGFDGQREGGYRGGYRGGRGGNRGGRGGYSRYQGKEYIDYDDPKVNESIARDKRDDRELIDYTSLFG